MAFHHLGRRSLNILLVVILLVAGSVAFAVYATQVSAASEPSFSFDLDGARYVTVYNPNKGRELNTSTAQKAHLVFGHWDTWKVTNGKWHYDGYFAGHEDLRYTTPNQIAGSLEVDVPGIGRISNGQMLTNPTLPTLERSPGEITIISNGPETLLGARTSEEQISNYHGDIIADDNLDYVDLNNFGNGGWGSGIDHAICSNIDSANSHPDRCSDPQYHLFSRGIQNEREGEAGLTTYMNDLFKRVAMQPTSGTGSLATVDQPRISPPLALAIAGGAFLIAALATSGICNIASCSETAQRVLVGVVTALVVLSITLFIGAGIGLQAALAAAAAVIAANNAVFAEIVAQLAAGNIAMGALGGPRTSEVSSIESEIERFISSESSFSSFSSSA